VVKALYRIAFGHSVRVFFQNYEDRDLFIDSHLTSSSHAFLLPGSGVDVKYFVPEKAHDSDQRLVFILIARLLWDKGVGEFVEAARVVKGKVPKVSFRILGFLDVENRSAVSRDAVEAWVQEGIVEYLGQTDDVRPYIAASDCVVLPSYYPEGTPRSLLEAAAMGKPIITTDTPGCRNVVDDGLNGWLCRKKDAGDLAKAMIRFAESSLEKKKEMGRQSRLKAERDFNENIVIEAYLAAVHDAISLPYDSRV
jgi:glycosyltransferase involved in cell wall biosynthesis